MMTMMPAQLANAVSVMLQGLSESQSLAAILHESGFVPAPRLVCTLVIPEDAKVILEDDLVAQGYGAVTLIFEVHARASLVYVLRETMGLVASDEKTSAPVLMERDLTCRLVGESADARLRCLYFGNEKKFFKIRTKQDHQVPHTTSDVVVKSVLDDEARLMCHSLIVVAPGADGTYAEQVNKNILMSRTARATSVPMLEVLANDVKCKHGAAVSRLDDEQIFYLQSRGLGASKTRQMLLEAFLQ